jgi:cytochrome c
MKIRLAIIFCALGAFTQFATGSLSGTARAQTVDPGEKVYRAKCQVCHSVAPDRKPGPIAPNLRGVVGRKSAGTAFKGYSPALKKYQMVWNAKTLDAFLAAPSRVVPGTRMTVAVSDAQQRQAIIKYLALNK